MELTVLWLEVGREPGSADDLWLSNLGMLYDAGTAFLILPNPLRILAVESSRLNPGPACALHLLLTLSFLFSIALCTNPPMPLVGDGGLSPKLRLCSEGIRLKGDCSASGETTGLGCEAPFCVGREADIDVGLPDWRRVSDCDDRDGCERSIGMLGASSLDAGRSLARPGNWRIEGTESGSSSSSRLRRYAAEPSPRSVV